MQYSIISLINMTIYVNSDQPPSALRMLSSSFIMKFSSPFKNTPKSKNDC